MVAPILLTRPPGAGAETLAEYRARGGYEALAAVRSGSADPIQGLDRAGLRGRGGAGFPTAKKWALAREATADVKYVVANGGEHEPGSRKDRLLVATNPHAVLEGVAICAEATGARAAWLYLIEDMADALESAERAIEESAELLGGIEVEVARAPTTYVAGEETAALEVIEGKKAWPRKKPPYPGQAGLFGKPTTVQNVETLAWVPAILRGEWGGGAMLATLGEDVRRPGVYEIPLGTTFGALVRDFGGGTKKGGAIRAILPALSSAFLPASGADVPMTHEAVRAAGSNLGCGGVSILVEGQCVVERLVEISEFFKREQCGQCPPCRMETNTLAAVMQKVATGEGGDYRAQIEKITSFTRGKGFCSLIEMAAAPVLSALAHFPEDFEAHAKTGRCP
jgi:NADH-quinone oxidoreductase subunit F